MQQLEHQQNHYQAIAAAIRFYLDNHAGQPGPEVVAAHLNLSQDHFQRLFSQWVGISPAQFLRFLNSQQARQYLPGQSVLQTAESLGLSSQSRLYDMMVTCQGVTPGEYRQQGRGLTIGYGWQESPFGGCFLARTARGICKLGFFDSDVERQRLLQELQADWSQAAIHLQQAQVAEQIRALFAWEYPAGQRPKKRQTLSFHLLLKGTPFQLQVWQALLQIPRGYCWSYSDVATYLGRSSAVRAVASAIAQNPVGYLIPCHRVIRQSGALNQYRWGAERKALILGRELLNK